MNRTGSFIARGIVCAATLLGCASVLWGVEFAGGTGEPNNPYQIATAEQLVAIGSDPNLGQKDFVLTASIDLYGTIWSSPVIPSFYGRLDGYGHTIRGLKARGAGPQGLFGRIENTGQVMNLSIVDVDLVGTGATGGLAAYSLGGIRNCHVAGRLACTYEDVGGLLGYNSGIVRESTSDVEVAGNSRIGGLVGRNSGGLLIHCGSTASVLGNGSIGGLVGSNEGTVSASYADSEVVGGYDSGGLAGGNSGRISTSYSTGIVAGGSDTGGLVGYHTGKITSCYSIAAVTGQAPPTATTVGGLVGRISTYTGAVTDSYFLAPADGGGPDNKVGVPLTASQMTQQAGFAGWDFWATDVDGIGNHWLMPAGSPPALAWQTEITGLQWVPDVTGLSLEQAQAALTATGFVLPGAVSHDFHRSLAVDRVICAAPSGLAPVGGAVGLVLSAGTAYDWADNPTDGTPANPYQIQTAGQLESLTDRRELWDRSFVLTADLDMTGRTYPAALIAYDMDSLTADFQGTPFTGVFDGQGYSIRNLTVQADGGGYVGLFGRIGPAGRVRRLHLLDATVRSTTGFAGILAGYNEGTLVDSSVIGGVLIGSYYYKDGLVGEDHGTVINCYADVTAVRASGPTSGPATR